MSGVRWEKGLRSRGNEGGKGGDGKRKQTAGGREMSRKGGKKQGSVK